MSVKCGNCHEHHETVSDVRSCYETRARNQREERKASTSHPTEGDWRPGDDGRSNVVLCPDCREAYQPPAEHHCALRTVPLSAEERWPFPQGRYAIRVKQDDGSKITKFYKVDKPNEGRWKGYVFVKVQASDDLHPIKEKAAREAVLDKIAKNPRKAMLRYGQELGKCGHCGRTLTDEESRARGIGPICAGKVAF